MAPLRVTLALAVLFVALAAHAQAPAGFVLPKSKCTKPDDFPGRLASDRRIKEWQTNYTEYGACVKKYTEDLRAIADAAMKAANEAVDEFNVYTKAVQEATKQ